MVETHNSFSKQSLIPVVGSLGTLLSILFVLTPIPTVIASVRDGKFRTLTYSLLLSGIMLNQFWLFYGLKMGDTAIITCSSFNVFVMLIYFYAYLFIERKPFDIIKNTAFLLAISAFDLIVLPAKVTGLIACFSNILNYISPLETLRVAVATKDANYINIVMTVMSLINAADWLLYGFLLDDVLMMAPPFVGVIVAVLQITVFLWTKGFISDNFPLISAIRLFSRKDSAVKTE